MELRLELLLMTTIFVISMCSPVIHHMWSSGHNGNLVTCLIVTGWSLLVKLSDIQYI